MQLNNIHKTGTWGESAERINNNFSKTAAEVEKLKYSTSRSKGLFSTDADLKKAYPNPKPGDWAIVGNSIPGPIWECKTQGIWVATGKTGGGDAIDLNGYVKEEILNDFVKKEAISVFIEAEEITDITTIL